MTPRYPHRCGRMPPSGRAPSHTDAWPPGRRVGRGSDAGSPTGSPAPPGTRAGTPADERRLLMTDPGTTDGTTQTEGQTARDIFPEDDGIPDIANDDSPRHLPERGPGVRADAGRAGDRDGRLRHDG